LPPASWEDSKNSRIRLVLTSPPVRKGGLQPFRPGLVGWLGKIPLIIALGCCDAATQKTQFRWGQRTIFRVSGYRPSS